MEKVNYSPLFTQYVVKKGFFKEDPFCLVDVGASGGISSYWKVFGENNDSFNDGLSVTKLLKLACLFEIFKLPDCAAELLNVYKNRLSSVLKLQKCLDLLVKGMGLSYSYSEHIQKFEKNFEDFYPVKEESSKKKFWNFWSQTVKS